MIRISSIYKSTKSCTVSPALVLGQVTAASRRSNDQEVAEVAGQDGSSRQLLHAAQREERQNRFSEQRTTTTTSRSSNCTCCYSSTVCHIAAEVSTHTTICGHDGRRQGQLRLRCCTCLQHLDSSLHDSAAAASSSSLRGSGGGAHATLLYTITMTI
jgi:hypothetical protein